MSEWKTVHYQFRPSEFDIESSPTTVYERKNIHEITVQSFEKEITEWECMERTYTKEEYELLNSPTMKTIMQTLSSIELQIAELGA